MSKDRILTVRINGSLEKLYEAFLEVTNGEGWSTSRLLREGMKRVIADETGFVEGDFVPITPEKNSK